MQKVTLGILAHVDAGKTTLSEGLLYASGALRKLGRVDHGDAFPRHRRARARARHHDLFQAGNAVCGR